MAMHCTRCGKLLPREDARFCSNCGNVISPQSLSAQAQSKPASSSSPLQQEKSKPLLREQIAQHSPDRPARPTRNTQLDEPPAWMKQLEASEYRKYSPEMLPAQRKSQKQDIAEKQGVEEKSAAPVEDVAREKEEPQKQPQAFPPPPIETPQPPILQDGSHGKSEPEVFSLHGEVEKSVFETHPFIEEKEFPLVERDINEDLPTEEVEAFFDERPLKGGILTEPVPVVDLNSELFVQERALREKRVIEDLPTTPMPSTHVQPPQRQNEESLPPGPSPEDRKRIVAQFDTMLLEVPASGQQRPQGGLIQILAPITSLMTRVFNRVQSLSSRQQIASLKPEQNNTPPPAHWQVSRQRALGQKNQENSRLILLIIGLLLIILVVAGIAIGLWVSITNASIVPPVTQPWQRFEDKKLGFSLSYPSGWKQEFDEKKSIIHLYDSSRTNQVDILIGQPQETDPVQYLQQQAKDLGLTDVKPGTPLSFGGIMWQHIEGNRVIQGATYTEGIFATIHGDRLYTFIQLAHQSIYADSENINFSSMRKTFRFL